MGKGSKPRRTTNKRQKKAQGKKDKFLAQLDEELVASKKREQQEDARLREMVIGAIGPAAARMTREAIEDEQRILGKPGVPDNDNVVPFVAKAGVPKTKVVVDHMGKILPPEDRMEITTEGIKMLTKRRVQLLRDHALPYPTLTLEVYVDEFDEFEARGFPLMFARAGCKKADSPDTADLVVFPGGADVDPAYYGEEAHERTYFDTQRDDNDVKLYMHCLEHGIPMFGVCRGAQFLHVMNGGKLYQHINNHNGSHSMYDVEGRTWVNRVSSVHHQSCMPNVAGGMEILGTSSVSTERWKSAKEVDKKRGMDIEAFFYRDTCCFGVQGHPEYQGYERYTQWCLKKIEELVCHNPDVEYKDTGRIPKIMNRRLRDDVIEMRDQGLLPPRPGAEDQRTKVEILVENKLA